jgi:hypothetical protein
MAQPRRKKILTVEEILAVEDLREKVVEVPEWGGCVKVRGLSKAESQRINREAMDDQGNLDMGKWEMLMAHAAIVEPTFESAQVEALKEKSAIAVNRVVAAALEVSGLGGDALTEAEKSFLAEAG